MWQPAISIMKFIQKLRAFQSQFEWRIRDVHEESASDRDADWVDVGKNKLKFIWIIKGFSLISGLPFGSSCWWRLRINKFACTHAEVPRPRHYPADVSSTAKSAVALLNG